MNASLRLSLHGLVLLALLVAVQAAPAQLTVYSGRSKSLVDPLIERFTRDTGIVVQVRYGDTSQLAAALMEEGDRSPADVFWAQDAGALGSLAEAGAFLTLPDEISHAVDPHFRGGSGLWVATSARARVLAYSPQRVAEDALPASVWDLTQPRWKDRVGIAPTNASFQAFVTAMRVAHGDEKTLAWLTALHANGVKSYPKNTAIVQAIAAGEIDLGLPNHYYLLRFLHEDANFPVAQTFFAAGDVGNLINIAGVGVLKTTQRRDEAVRFTAYLLTGEAQRFFVEETFEYPVSPVPVEATAAKQLLPLNQLIERSPSVPLDALQDLEGTLELLRQAGLL